MPEQTNEERLREIETRVRWDHAEFACEKCNRVVPHQDAFSGVRCALCPYCDDGSTLLSRDHRLRGRIEQLEQTLGLADELANEASNIVSTEDLIEIEERAVIYRAARAALDNP